MSSQSLNPELAAKVLLLANLQRNLMQNQHMLSERLTESEQRSQQQHSVHPLLIPSLNVSSQKISAMLAALTPSNVNNSTIASKNVVQSTANLSSYNNNNSMMNNRTNGSSFGWGNRERKMEENWRMQNRNI